MVAAARGYGCLTGISSLFQLFELCKTAAVGGKTILQQSDGGAKWSVVVRCFPFLEGMSERGDFRLTASENADNANGPNCMFLAGLDVEKLRGEGTFLLTRSVAQKSLSSRKV